MLCEMVTFIYTQELRRFTRQNVLYSCPHISTVVCMVCQHTTVTHSKKVKETIPRGCHDGLSIFGVVELSFKCFKDGFHTLKGLYHGTCCFPVKTVQKSFFLTLTQAENIVLILRTKTSIIFLQEE